MFDPSPEDEQAENERVEHEQERELEEKVPHPAPTDGPEVAYCLLEYCVYGRTGEGHMVQCTGEGCRGNGWYHVDTCLPSWESVMATATRQRWQCYDCQLRKTYRTRRKQARYVRVEKSWISRI
jgi:hypothetical protein